MKWVKMGWGEDFLSERRPGLIYHVSYKNAVYSDKNPLEISKRVIEEISQNYPPPYTLMCSGGIDSQTMLWFWHNSGVPFKVLSVLYKNTDDDTNFNDHDIEKLREFANKYQIPVHYKDFDIINFLENDLWTYATKYECSSPQITAHMAMSEDIEGTVIFAGNFIEGSEGYNYTILGLKRYADTSGRSIIPYFLMHDAELAGSINKYRPSPSSRNNLNDYEVAVAYLHNGEIPVIPQKEKLTGFEKIKDYYDEKNKKLNLVSWKEKCNYKNDSKRVFDLVFRYRLRDKLKYDDRIVYKK